MSVNKVSTKQGRKDDQGKTKYHLIPNWCLKTLAEHYTRGAVKYGDNNWRSGISFSRCYDAIQRHLSQWKSGKDKDTDDNDSYNLMAVVFWCFAIMFFTHHERIDLDDREPEGWGEE